MSKRRHKRLRISTSQGVFEINADGRPDGGPSMLEKYREDMEEHERSVPAEPFVLDDEAIRALGEEALLYRLRREYFFANEDYDRARRDVLQGIGIIEFIAEHAGDPEQGRFYWQFRADQEIFLRMCESQALMERKDYAAARREIEQALTFVTDFYESWGGDDAIAALEERREFLAEKFQEIGEAWENDPDALRNTAPSLEEQLEVAVAHEDYERAATLRDAIRERDQANA